MATPATHLVVPLVGGDSALSADVARALASAATALEFRVDLIDDRDAVAETFGKPHEVPFVLTIRSAEEGGGWDGDDSERVALIERLGLLLPGYVDVELATWHRSANLRQKIGLVCDTGTSDTTDRPRNKLILSHHNFAETPGDLTPVFAALLATPAHVIKAAFMATDTTDALRVLAALREYAPQRPTVALAMGEAGLISRVLAKKFGAWCTFAAADSGAESAPGQPTVQTLKDLYRWDELGPATKVYGVVGWPVTHSQSPRLHNDAMRRAAIDGVYLPLPVSPERAAFDRFMDYVADNPWLDVSGLSVTLPHKTHAFDWLARRGASISDVARRAGAVNTLYRTEAGDWAGENSDVLGILAALEKDANIGPDDWSSRHVLVLGAGGAARAAIVAAQTGGGRVALANRTRAKADALATEFGCEVVDWDARHLRCDLVINTTSVGLWPAVDAAPLDARQLGEGAAMGTPVVFDTVYRPAQTLLLRTAAERGCRPVTGVSMFVAQAAKQFELWHGCAAGSGFGIQDSGLGRGE